MKSLKALNDPSLIENTMALVAEERRISTQILDHLREIERRQLFFRHGCASLHEFAIRILGYSDGAAHRRISAMRLIRDVPEVAQSLEEGTLSLSTACT